MAEILVKAISIGNAPGQYQVGDPVVIMEDGHQWGSEEGLPKFWIIKIPGLRAESVQVYIENKLNADGAMQLRRRFKFDISLLPISVRNQLLTKGSYTISNFQTALNYIKEKL